MSDVNNSLPPSRAFSIWTDTAAEPARAGFGSATPGLHPRSAAFSIWTESAMGSNAKSGTEPPKSAGSASLPLQTAKAQPPAAKGPSTALAGRDHTAFSLSRVWTLATHTATQLLRMRILAFLAVFCIVAIGAAFVFPKQSPEQQLLQLKNWSMGAMYVSSLVFAIAATSLLLPRDLEDRILYTILSKPVPRYEYLLGKLLGMLLLIGCGLLIMDIVFSLVLWMKQGLITSAIIASMREHQEATTENIAAMEASIAHYGLSWTQHAEVWLIFLQASVVTSLTLLISTFASTTLFTIVTSGAMTVAGFGVQLMRDWFFHKPYGPMEKALGALLAIACPDLSMFDLSSAGAQVAGIPWLVLGQLTGYCIMYLAGYLMVSYLFFVEKEL